MGNFSARNESAEGRIFAQELNQYMRFQTPKTELAVNGHILPNYPIKLSTMSAEPNTSVIFDENQESFPNYPESLTTNDSCTCPSPQALAWVHPSCP